MKSIITVLGKDRVGIIAKVCIYLSETNVNILDISQTIVDGYFNMMMIVEISETSKPLEVVTDELAKIGEDLNVVISMQHEDIFNSMHRI